MLVGEAFETRLGQAHQLAVSQGIDAGRVRCLVEHRHFADGFASADVADQVRPTERTTAEGGEGARADQIDGIGVITLTKQQLPRWQAEPFNLMFDRVEHGFLDPVEEGQEGEVEGHGSASDLNRQAV